MTIKEEQLNRYRERHVIAAINKGSLPYCEHDLLRIVPRRPYTSDAWRHDPDQVKRLVAETALSARLAARVGR